MAVYGIDWGFGEGKTSTCAYLASNSGGRTLIWSNIKMNEFAVPNYRYFDDWDFAKTLRTINAFNDVERQIYGYRIKNNTLPQWERDKFTKHILLLDEAGIILNANKWRDVDDYLTDYINQQRKNFEDIYICTADGWQTGKSLRRYCELWMYPRKISKLPFLKDFREVRIQKRDPETMAVITEKYLAKDDRGDDVVKERPLDYYLDWFYAPFTWKVYDDLHKNIIDPNKYEDINREVLKELFDKRPKHLEGLKKIQPLYDSIYPNREEDSTGFTRTELAAAHN